MDSDLIFDLGMHRGEDTAFYLAKGYRVVAVEADPHLAAAARAKFSEAIANRRLVIVDKAISSAPGRVTLHRNARSVWNTLDAGWAARNELRGHCSEPIEIEATTLPDVMREHGVPFYLKIDIEGMDMVALESLHALDDRPKYVSIESDKVSFRALREEFATLRQLGYGRFKIVDQNDVPKQREPSPPMHGANCSLPIVYGSSGLFGEEAPGQWMPEDEAIERYRSIFLRYALVGDDPYLRSKALRKLLKHLGFRASWYDTHAVRD
jgi:FkbM family methyltransferase